MNSKTSLNWAFGHYLTLMEKREKDKEE